MTSLATKSDLSEAVHLFERDFKRALHRHPLTTCSTRGSKKSEGNQTGGWIALAEFFRPR